MKRVMAELNRLEKVTAWFFNKRLLQNLQNSFETPSHKNYFGIHRCGATIAPPFTWRVWTSAPGMNSVADSLSWRNLCVAQKSSGASTGKWGITTAYEGNQGKTSTKVVFWGAALEAFVPKASAQQYKQKETLHHGHASGQTCKTQGVDHECSNKSWSAQSRSKHYWMWGESGQWTGIPWGLWWIPSKNRHRIRSLAFQDHENSQWQDKFQSDFTLFGDVINPNHFYHIN